MSHQTYNYNTSWEKVARLFPTEPALRVLDLGCGDGRLLESLVATHEVFGIDQSATGVEEARRRGIKAAVGNVDGIPIPFTDLNVVLALDILEHLQHLSPTLKEIKASLQPDGYFIMALPNHFDLHTRLDLLRGKGMIKWSQRAFEHKAWEYQHLRFLNLSEIMQMLEEHGFYPDIVQFNFMSQGLLPTRFTPSFIRSSVTRAWPNLWSGKFVIRARLNRPENVRTIILDKTPSDF